MMRLKLKIVYLSAWYFLELKIVKNGYCRNGGFIFASDLGVSFLGIPKWMVGGFLKKGLWVVSLYTYFRGVGLH